MMSSIQLLNRVPSDEEVDQIKLSRKHDVYEVNEEGLSVAPSRTLEFYPTLDRSPFETHNNKDVSKMNGDDDDKATRTYNDDSYRGLQFHTEYRKYFLMLNVGVPKEWVVKVCQVDGRDPTLLDDLQNFSMQSLPKEFGGSKNLKVKSNPSEKKSSYEEEEKKRDKLIDHYENLMEYYDNTSAFPNSSSPTIYDESSRSQWDEEKQDDLSTRIRTSTSSTFNSPKGIDNFLHNDSSNPLKQEKELHRMIENSPLKKQEEKELVLSKDPRFSRYFLMLRARVPVDRVRKVVEMDGKDPSVLDLDPNQPYLSQISCSNTLRNKKKASSDCEDSKIKGVNTDDYEQKFKRSFSFKKYSADAILSHSADIANISMSKRFRLKVEQGGKYDSRQLTDFTKQISEKGKNSILRGKFHIGDSNIDLISTRPNITKTDSLEAMYIKRVISEAEEDTEVERENAENVPQQGLDKYYENKINQLRLVIPPKLEVHSEEISIINDSSSLERDIPQVTNHDRKNYMDHKKLDFNESNSDSSFMSPSFVSHNIVPDHNKFVSSCNKFEDEVVVHEDIREGKKSCSRNAIISVQKMKKDDSITKKEKKARITAMLVQRKNIIANVEEVNTNENMTLDLKKANITAMLTRRNGTGKLFVRGNQYQKTPEKYEYRNKMALDEKKANLSALHKCRNATEESLVSGYQQKTQEKHVSRSFEAAAAFRKMMNNNNMSLEDKKAKMSLFARHVSGFASSKDLELLHTGKKTALDETAPVATMSRKNKNIMTHDNQIQIAASLTDKPNGIESEVKNAASTQQGNNDGSAIASHISEKKQDISEFFKNRKAVISRKQESVDHIKKTAEEPETTSSSSDKHSEMPWYDKKLNIAGIFSSRIKNANRDESNRDATKNLSMDMLCDEKNAKANVALANKVTQDSLVTIMVDKSELDNFSNQKKKIIQQSSFEEQVKSCTSTANPHPLENDAEYKKYFRMFKVGLPMGAVKQAILKDGKDPSILSLDPEESVHVQKSRKPKEKMNQPPAPLLKEDPDYQKYFKMQKLGLPLGAVKQAMMKDGRDSTILDLDPEKTLNSQRNILSPSLPLKEDPEYHKYFKMLRLGMPLGAAKQAMTKDGKDCTILDLDPQKPLNDQRSNLLSSQPLKENPDYQKYFKMLRLGMPLGAAKQAMMKDGKDCTILDLDPEKPLNDQRPNSNQCVGRKKGKDVSKRPKLVRKRLFWNSIDKSNLHGSLWSKFQSSNKSLNLSGLDYDEEEFANLFTLDREREQQRKSEKMEKSRGKKRGNKKKTIQLIDSRRQMNGSILLKKYNLDCATLSMKVDIMDSHEMSETQLLALIQLLPSKDEALAIRSYLPTTASEKKSAISMLGECEKYMAAMLEVDNAAGKLKVMTYKVQFHSLVESLENDFGILRQALLSVRNSDRLARLMLFALKLGNTLNAGGESGKDVVAITLDSLLKLQDAKAFDKKTSVLQYLVSIIEKNDKDILKVSTDLLPALKAERIMLESLAKTISDLQEGLKSTKTIVEGNKKENSHVEVFVLEAEIRLKSLSEEFQKCKNDYAELLIYFGENSSMQSNEFFSTLSRFIVMFESARAELTRLQEVKARKGRTTQASKKKSIIKRAKSVEGNLESDRSAVLYEIIKRGNLVS